MERPGQTRSGITTMKEYAENSLDPVPIEDGMFFWRRKLKHRKMVIDVSTLRSSLTMIIHFLFPKKKKKKKKKALGDWRMPLSKAIQSRCRSHAFLSTTRLSQGVPRRMFVAGGFHRRGPTQSQETFVGRLSRERRKV
jgi:hypothetical protein